MNFTEKALLAVEQGEAQHEQAQRDRRDFFAAAALTGLLAGGALEVPDRLIGEIPKAAREFADALIAELDK